MSIRGNVPKYFVLSFLTAGVALGLWSYFKPDAGSAGHTVNVRIPELSASARIGKSAFDANCASCHGQNAAGTDKGPPLIHDIYNPGHHADASIFLAAQRGVRRHHWRYGDMPPQPQVTDEQIGAVVRYIRELQVANGIVFRPHRM